jgi:hypothetical protein
VIPNYGGPRKYAYFDALDALADSPSASASRGGARRSAVKQRTLDVPLREAEEGAARGAGDGRSDAQIDEALSKLDEAKVVQMSQRVALGEIREASYRAASASRRRTTTWRAAKLFDTIRNVPGRAHPDWVQAVDDLLTAKGHAEDGGDAVADRTRPDLMQNQAAVALDEITKKYQAARRRVRVAAR